MRLGSRPRRCGRESGEVGKADWSSEIWVRRLSEADMVVVLAVQRGQVHLNPQFALRASMRFSWGSEAKPSV